MSWIAELQKTYDNCLSAVGKEDKNRKGEDYCLLPIAHTSQNAQVEILIDFEGNFKRAQAVIKTGGQQTILPATEGSAGRSGSKLAPLTLGDKLQYVAGDYTEYGGSKKPGFNKYHSRLRRWCKSAYSLPEIQAVYSYISKKKVIHDLIEASVLIYDETKRYFPKKWEGEKERKPKIFSALQGDQLDSLVRFIVDAPDKKQPALWRDSRVWESWINYYLENKILEDNFDIEEENKRHPVGKKVFCYVKGKEQNFAGNHPSKIRNAGDGAKLISSNDTSGFTFRGRFLDDQQASTIGYEVSQKAHNVLRWLIEKQGYRDGDLAIVAWSPQGAKIPDPMSSSDNFSDLFGVDETEYEREIVVDTAEHTGRTISKRIAGYATKMGPTDNVDIIGISSATPGRLSVSYYRSLAGSDFLERMEKWHTGCAWLQRYSKDRIFYGAPSPLDISTYAYGKKLGKDGPVTIDDKLKRATIQRILPCIIDMQPIPMSIVNALVRAASKRISYKEYEWEKLLGITCAVYRYHKKEESYKMPLERERNTRDYLYGRLLAVADCLERFALSRTNETRLSNATRLMQRFADHPCSTWRSIELGLTPYKARLGHKTKKYEKEIEEITNLFIADDFCKNNALSGEFLLGFHSQRSALMKGSNNNHEGDEK